MSLVMTGCVGGLICLAVVLFAGVWTTLFGFLDATRRSVVLCYATGWLLLPTVLGICGYWAIVVAYDCLPGLNLCVELPLLGRVEWGLMLGTALMLPAAATFFLWFFHLRRMLRVSRFANA